MLKCIWNEVIGVDFEVMNRESIKTKYNSKYLALQKR
jgi:hypothetical protein